jgi:phosphopantothenoylcysteine decarboxylase/phosphopantothenate--cysteine ligase
LAQTDKQPLAGYEVLLCLTGGIACYKSAELASKLVQQGCGVSVAMTDAAREFIAPLTLQALTGRRVYTSLWQSSEDYSSQHISLTERADLMVIAPATANMLARIACGLADDLVSTMALSAPGACKMLLCPAMNTRMYQAPATQANLKTLQGWGLEILGPASGRLACNTVGPGRMVEPGEILAACQELLTSSPAKSSRS